jgi:hypothetical protein
MTTTASFIPIDPSEYWMMMALEASTCVETQALARTCEIPDENLLQTALDAYETSSNEAARARNAKWDQHKFGLCDNCDTGLDDRSDFVLARTHNGGTVLHCVTCSCKPIFARRN